MDVGTRNKSITSMTTALDQILTQDGVRHSLETYDGGLTSGVAERLEKKVLPFFTDNLAFGKTGKR